MPDDIAVDELVSEFFIDTCRLHYTIDVKAIAALGVCVIIMNDEDPEYPETDLIALTTGSVAELHIDPLLSCVGDTDIMFHPSNLLAMPSGYSPPTELPAEFNNIVLVCEIADSEYPSYVYLVSSYLLIECIDDGMYGAVEIKGPLYQAYISHSYKGLSPRYLHGPAIASHWTIRYASPVVKRVAGYNRSLDMVPSHRCLLWPAQAADWPTRHRSYGWPDSATVDRAVSDGCDVVHIAHHLCRQDEWLTHIQWRLSFSRAEITLINNWMPIQQIAYHVLRLFVKTERLFRLTDSADNSETGTLKKLSH